MEVWTNHLALLKSISSSIKNKVWLNYSEGCYQMIQVVYELPSGTNVQIDGIIFKKISQSKVKGAGPDSSRPSILANSHAAEGRIAQCETNSRATGKCHDCETPISCLLFCGLCLSATGLWGRQGFSWNISSLTTLPNSNPECLLLSLLIAVLAKPNSFTLLGFGDGTHFFCIEVYPSGRREDQRTDQIIPK